MVPRKVCVGEELELRLDIVNVGRRPGKLVKIIGADPPQFKAFLPPFCNLQEDGSLEIVGKTIGGFQSETIKLKLVAPKVGNYCLTPKVLYKNDSDQTKTFGIQPLTITVQPAKPEYETLAGRVPTGYEDLDALLFGGIPERCAMILSSPSTEERDRLVKRFVRTGLATGETVFDVTTDPLDVNSITETHPSNFYQFICNLQAESTAQNSPNHYWLKGVENLTDIDIALTKAFRTLNTSVPAARRICFEIISDALLQHHAVNTRRWLKALLPTLKSKGFTILATINPKMHSQEEVEAILGIFEGEIRMTEKETAQGTEQTLRIRKLLNQKYSEREILLNKEALKD
jgi:KaiC/GvpD/RAD55 family RecA-like ATPase